MVANQRFLFILLAILLAGAMVLGIVRRGQPVVLQSNLEQFPPEVSGLNGTDDSFSPRVYQELNADYHLYRHYRGQQGQVDLYIGYYGTAKGGRTGHNPYACLPGAGWAIVERGELRVPTSYRPEGVILNYMVASKDGFNNVLLHWYQSSGTQVLATGLQQNVQRFMGRVLHNRNDGAYVQVSAIVADGQILENRILLESFARRVLELLPDYWPVEG